MTTDLGSSSSVDVSGGSQPIAGEFPSIIANGLNDKHEGPLLKFSQAGRRAVGSGSSSNDEMGFSSTVQPAQEIEVCECVCME